MKTTEEMEDQILMPPEAYKQYSIIIFVSKYTTFEAGTGSKTA
jgi:hypothetical protein